VEISLSVSFIMNPKPPDNIDVLDFE